MESCSYYFEPTCPFNIEIYNNRDHRFLEGKPWALSGHANSGGQEVAVCTWAQKVKEQTKSHWPLKWEAMNADEMEFREYPEL